LLVVACGIKSGRCAVICHKQFVRFVKKAACRNDRLLFYLYFCVFAIKKYNNWKSEYQDIMMQRIRKPEYQEE